MNTSLRNWQMGIVALLTTLNAYAIADGFRYKTFLGIILAIASLIALGFCIRLFKEMNRVQREEDIS